MRKFRKILSSALVTGMVLSMGVVPVNAQNDEGFADTFEEATAKGIVCGKPATEMTKDELYARGYQFYDGKTRPLIESRATLTNVLGYVNGSGTYNVRATSGGTGTIVGTVKQKDIVKVRSISGDYAYVDFIAADTTTKTGYMLNSGVLTPAYSWDSPTGTTGSITQYYGAADTSASHTGVDIGGVSTTTNLKAVNAGTATFKTQTVVSGGITYYAEYGRYIFLDTKAGSNNKRAVYAHLSSFNGYSTSDLSSEGYPGFGLTATVTEVATKTVAKGDTLGKTGNSGRSQGNHLHFEVRTGTSTTREDPFLYIVFPKITKK